MVNQPEEDSCGVPHSKQPLSIRDKVGDRKYFVVDIEAAKCEDNDRHGWKRNESLFVTQSDWFLSVPYKVPERGRK